MAGADAKAAASPLRWMQYAMTAVLPANQKFPPRIGVSWHQMPCKYWGIEGFHPGSAMTRTGDTTA